MSRFNFKQFSVYQDQCAMKVGTDGVLLGSWCRCDNASLIWDVGCGTGLIAMMLAQRNSKAHILAVEIDDAAACQAAENVTRSPWPMRIEVMKGDIADLAPDMPMPDLIVSNPPFFTSALLSSEASRSKARHDNTLPLQKLMQIAAGVLSDHGTLAIIIPYDRGDDAVYHATIAGLAPVRLTAVRTTPSKQPKRLLMQFGRQAIAVSEPLEEHIIQDESGHYSEWYNSLTSEFYL